jgi:hypothetical protein
MPYHTFKQRTIGNRTNNSYVGILPEIDKSRKTAVYIRQSDEDADDEHGESRQTQLDLINFAMRLRREDNQDGVIIYDEGAGRSGRLRIDERPKLQRLWADISTGIIGTIIVAREDRLFRDKHGGQVAIFTEKAELMRLTIIVPPLSPKSSLKVYDFTNFSHLRAFQDKMRAAYDYIEFHIGYMHLNQRNKASRGCYDGRSLPPGLVVPRLADKADRTDQRPVVYQPWQEKMQWLFRRFKDLNWGIPQLIREIEQLPYLFPMPSEDDYARFIFKNSLTKVPGGFKPRIDQTVKNWLTNAGLIGWWIVSEESGEVIIDNHDPVIDRASFEEAYIHITGYNLDGVLIPGVRRERTFQARRSRVKEPGAVLRYILKNPGANITVTPGGKPHDNYVAYKRDDGKVYTDSIFAIPCADLDDVVVDRLATISEVDAHLADRILANIQAVQEQQAEAALTIEEELAGFEAQIVELRTRLISLKTILNDQETLEGLGNKLNGLIGERDTLKEKKRTLSLINGKEEVAEFYDTIGNVKALFHKLTLEKQQKLFGLVANKVEIVPLSPHWLRITIHWVGSVFNRPDVCLLWRQNGARGPRLKQWELDLLREQYPVCKRYTDLLTLLPNRTWSGIRKTARETLNIDV